MERVRAVKGGRDRREKELGGEGDKCQGQVKIERREEKK